jgi:hypothetical protein
MRGGCVGSIGDIDLHSSPIRCGSLLRSAHDAEVIKSTFNVRYEVLVMAGSNVFGGAKSLFSLFDC